MSPKSTRSRRVRFELGALDPTAADPVMRSGRLMLEINLRGEG